MSDNRSYKQQRHDAQKEYRTGQTPSKFETKEYRQEWSRLKSAEKSERRQTSSGGGGRGSSSPSDYDTSWVFAPFVLLFGAIAFVAVTIGLALWNTMKAPFIAPVTTLVVIAPVIALNAWGWWMWITFYKFDPALLLFLLGMWLVAAFALSAQLRAIVANKRWLVKVPAVLGAAVFIGTMLYVGWALVDARFLTPRPDLWEISRVRDSTARGIGVDINEVRITKPRVGYYVGMWEAQTANAQYSCIAGAWFEAPSCDKESYFWKTFPAAAP
ncbi:MAG: hypothetical protein EOP84_00800 [Verrucomicrobiaceae bacterium]|nr:MAG: hypothetical protein EOP84_00800 [Verrucomicrobiaceae bacterium]